MSLLKHSLLLLLATMTCLAASKDSKETIRCTNSVPGFEKMLRGVDITELDMLPANILTSNGFKSSIVAYSCNLNHTRIFGHGPVFQQADQVKRITTLPAGMAVSNVRLYKTAEDVRDRMISNAGLGGVDKNFSFATSPSYTEMQRTLMDGSMYIAEMYAVDSAHRVDFKPYWSLEMDEDAKTFVDKFLTGTYSSNPAAYKSFIDTFGTHYFSSGIFGGYIRALYQVSTDYVRSYGEKSTQKNTKAAFENFISHKGEAVSGPPSVEYAFSRESSYVVKYYGGDTTLMDEDIIPNWMATVDQDPWLFSGHLTPISELISDEEKKEAMEQAVHDHMTKSYLDGLQELVNNARVSHKIARVSPLGCLLGEFTSEINRMKAKLVLDEGEMEQLGKNITNSLTLRPVYELFAPLQKLQEDLVSPGCTLKKDLARLRLWLAIMTTQERVLEGEFLMLKDDINNGRPGQCNNMCFCNGRHPQRQYTSSGVKWHKLPYGPPTGKQEMVFDNFSVRLNRKFCSPNHLSSTGNLTELVEACQMYQESSEE